MITNATGGFRSFDAKVVIDGDDFATASVRIG
jgi:polyisoprenoid-binding protein YceI